MKKLLVFDLDGTLIDSRRDLATGINLMRAHFGLEPLGYETVAGHVGDGVRQLVERSLSDAPQVNVDEAMPVNTASYKAHLVDETIVYPGVIDGLKSFAAAGHTLAVLTNKPQPFTDLILAHFGLTDLFTYIIGAGHGTFALKPDPESLNFIISDSGFDLADCWMIGDHRTDMNVGDRANVSTAFCEYGIGVTGDNEPTKRVNSFDELAAIFN